MAWIAATAPAVTTWGLISRSVTARFSPPDLPRSMTTDRACCLASLSTARFSPSSPDAPDRFQLAAWRSVRKMTSFCAMDDAPSTRSIASKLAARSVPPWGSVTSSISLRTSAWFGDGSPITTRGGSAISTTLMTSP